VNGLASKTSRSIASDPSAGTFPTITDKHEALDIELQALQSDSVVWQLEKQSSNGHRMNGRLTYRCSHVPERGIALYVFSTSQLAP
jgi:hypothetical protein